MHTHSHTHIYTHAHIHTRTHIYITITFSYMLCHTHVHTCIGVQHTCVHTHSYTHSCVHTLPRAYAHPTLGPLLPRTSSRVSIKGSSSHLGSSGECGLSGGDLTDRDVTGTVCALFTTSFGDSVTDLLVGLQANEPRLCPEAEDGHMTSAGSS